MKKVVGIVFVILLILSGFSVTSYADDTVEIYVNGYYLYCDQPAMIHNGRTLVPLRAICEALSCEVMWDEETQTAQIENEVTKVSVQIGNYRLTKVDRYDIYDIETIQLEVPPIVHNGRTLVPVRAIAEALHADVQWDADYRCVRITMEYDYIEGFCEGYAAVGKDGKCGFINEKRELVVPLEYDDVHNYVEGYAAVEKNGKEGFINTRGQIVVPIIYEEVYDFSEGYAVAVKNYKCGFINTKGEVVIPFIYDYAHRFSEGYAGVLNDRKMWGYVNKNGEIVIPFEYEDVNVFVNGKAFVEKNGDIYEIDKNGKRVYKESLTSEQQIQSEKSSEQSGKQPRIVSTTCTVTTNPNSDKTHIQVVANGTTVYNQSVSSSFVAVDIPVSGEAPLVVEVYRDGVLLNSQTYN